MENNIKEKRIELHLHTNMNKMNGIESCKYYIDKARIYGMTSLAITDNAVVQAFPEVQSYLERINDNEFKVIYGLEANIEFENNKIHLATILVKNKIGLKNLYKLVSISYLKYYDNKPIIPFSIYKEYSEGLIIGACFNNGELFEKIINNMSDEELCKTASKYDFLEICSVNDNKRNIVKKIIYIGNKINKTVVAISNYFSITEEMLKEFEYLGKEKAYEVVITNTNKIADMCDYIQPISDEKCYPYFPNSEIELKKLAFKGAYKIYGDTLSKEVEERLNKELKLIIENGYSTLYIIAQRLVKKAKDDGYIVGNRGAVGSSLVAYCLGITETDSIKYNIPFEVFAGFNGDKEPDIDLNVAYEYQDRAQEYISNILEGATTYKAGHHPGGIIVVPKGREIYEFTPIQYSEDECNSNIITTHFDYYYLDYNLLKLDILEGDISSILYKLTQITGIEPTSISLEDVETLQMICSSDTIGIPEFESEFIRNIILETNPSTFEDLIKVLGLANGTYTWEENAQNLIKNGIATLKEVIACRDDIFNYLVEKGIESEISYNIMEYIRKGSARRKINETTWKGYKKIMKNHNVPNWYIKSCEKISYLFTKAHATGYLINYFRIAWYKVHYPKAFNEIIKSEI